MSCAFSLALATLAAGCIAGRPIDFDEEASFPPSIVSQEDAEYPSREIGQLDLDVPVESPELPLQVIVRDPDIDQTLEYRMFLNAENPPSTTDIPIDAGVVEPNGEVERPFTFTVDYDALAPGECNKIEITVAGAFASNVEWRRPEVEGDVDNRTWWVEVTDAEFPVITVGCR